MPYYIEENNPACAVGQWATTKDDGEVMGCHDTKQEAIDQAVAISIAEESEYEGERSEVRVALGDDKYSTSEEASARADAIGCSGYHTMTEDGETVFMPCDSHEAYANIVNGSGYRAQHDDGASTPAPPQDQIEGSDENEPGSAKGAGGDIKLSEATETALRNKVKEHNDKMSADDRPDWTRTTYGQLAAVYRRGAGAYSSSHRPGVSRGAWAMARVNAYLYLLRNGNPENSNYVTDNDLLPEGHPKSTRSIGSQLETRDVNLVPPAYMRAAARQGLRYYEQGLAGDGIVDRTITEARQMSRGDALTPDKWVRIAAWIARHMTDLDAPAANPEADGYPSPGVVAHLLWGSGPSKRAARRAMEYAEGVVGRLEEENRTLLSVEAKQMAKIETRTNTTQFELRELEGTDGMTFEGYASVFNSESEDLGGFRERVAPGAFKRSLRSRNDIKLLWNHDTGSVLGSTRAGTLTLVEDDRGLKVRAVLPNTTLGRDTAELIRRGDVDSMSFGFSVIKDTWDETGTNRTLNAVRLHEVSMVAFPAYAGTAGTTVMRGLDKIAKRANVDADELADALLKLEEGAELSADEANMLSRVVDELKPATEEPAETTTEEYDMVALKKKKLELLEKY